MRAFLDANGLFGAAYQDQSDLLIFFDLARAGCLELTTSAFAIEEARRNVVLKHPARSAAFERLVAEIALAPAPSTEHIAIAMEAGLPQKDIPILAAALGAEADSLSTGDRTHVGRLFARSVGRLTVQRPTDGLSAILLDARRHAGKRVIPQPRR